MSRRIATLLVDVAIGLAAGLVATRTYGLAQEALYRSTPRHIRRQEERVRPAPSSQVAAEKTAASLGYCLDERRRDLAGTAVHYGLGMAWGPVLPSVKACRSAQSSGREEPGPRTGMRLARP
jgi:hypothetical protein